MDTLVERALIADVVNPVKGLDSRTRAAVRVLEEHPEAVTVTEAIALFTAPYPKMLVRSKLFTAITDALEIVEGIREAQALPETEEHDIPPSPAPEVAA